MSLHFQPAEYQQRLDAARRLIVERGLNGLLLFAQESMFYLTGYDTAGYSQFQCMLLGADGRLVLLTRSADQRQARMTSTVADVRVWVDRADANPAGSIVEIAAELGIAQGPLGVEFASVGLGAVRAELLRSAFAGQANLVDASDLVTSLRLVKSASELAYVREAGRLADKAFETAIGECRPGRTEGDILGSLYDTILRGGGDPAAGRFVCGAGPNALLVRYFTGHGTIASDDQVTIEFAAAYRHYHCALMRTAVVGKVDPAHRRMHAAALEALEACEAALVPGRSFGDLFTAHQQVLDAAGYAHARLNACGYSLGSTYPPTWMDWPMAFAGNPVVLGPGMVVFLHMILLDSDTGLAMSLGETFIVTEGGPERLSRLSRELVAL